MQLLKSHRSFGGKTEFWQHDSQVTKTVMKFAIFRPSIPARGCLIWLSGLTCTEENFITKAGAQRYLAEHELMVICPDTSPRGLDLPGEHESYDFGSGAGFYLNASTPGYRDHYQMDRYIVEEIYEMIQGHFGFLKNISISGHSMGGHGALVLGLRNPKKFAAISAFSPIVNPMECPWGQKAFRGYLGDERECWKEYDACELLRQKKLHPNPILIDQGLADEFYEQQLLTPKIEQTCQQVGQDLQLNYQEGYDHSYYFIASFIESHIQFHSKIFS